nr:MAG TPA: hypothetical protein [Caudoviricetes sp.]
MRSVRISHNISILMIDATKVMEIICDFISIFA